MNPMQRDPLSLLAIEEMVLRASVNEGRSLPALS
jgi:hypothetical protein